MATVDAAQDDAASTMVLHACLAIDRGQLAKASELIETLQARMDDPVLPLLRAAVEAEQRGEPMQEGLLSAWTSAGRPRLDSTRLWKPWASSGDLALELLHESAPAVYATAFRTGWVGKAFPFPRIAAEPWIRSMPTSTAEAVVTLHALADVGVRENGPARARYDAIRRDLLGAHPGELMVRAWDRFGPHTTPARWSAEAIEDLEWVLEASGTSAFHGAVFRESLDVLWPLDGVDAVMASAFLAFQCSHAPAIGPALMAMQRTRSGSLDAAARTRVSAALGELADRLTSTRMLLHHALATGLYRQGVALGGPPEWVDRADALARVVVAGQNVERRRQLWIRWPSRRVDRAMTTAWIDDEVRLVTLLAGG